MADSSLSSSPAMEIVSSYIPRHCRRSQRIDYHLLNDGSDDEAPTEDRIFKRPVLDGLTGTLEPITPDDSASQLDQTRSSPVESLQQTEFPVCGSSEISQRSSLSTHDRPQDDYGRNLSCFHSRANSGHGKGARDQPRTEKSNAEDVTGKLPILREQLRLPIGKIMSLNMGFSSTALMVLRMVA